MAKAKVKKSGRGAHEDQHDLFCLEFSKDFNGTRAYLAAYPDSSEDAAAVGAWRLLRKAKIQAQISQIVQERKKRVLLEGDEILARIAELAESDLRRLISREDGTVLPVHDWPDDIARAVASFEVKELVNPFTGKKYGEIKKIKLWDKPKPLELLGKNQKLFTDVLETKNTHTITATDEQVDGATARFKDKL